MKTGQGRAEKKPPLKVAEKNLHCYNCGRVIPKGSAYLRKEFVRLLRRW